ncbi:hypothetical protein B0O80DRAFT_421830 [Mortierella sp. GBAus27b]|nr:hypothetical protein B0O80DRAFT_421830 [Mortierella sp. GBAus27b]
MQITQITSGSMGATVHWSPPDVTVRIEVTISMLHENSGVGASHHLQPVQSRRLHTGRQHDSQARINSGCYVAIVDANCTLNSKCLCCEYDPLLPVAWFYEHCCPDPYLV